MFLIFAGIHTGLKKPHRIRSLKLDPLFEEFFSLKEDNIKIRKNLSFPKPLTPKIKQPDINYTATKDFVC